MGKDKRCWSQAFIFRTCLSMKWRGKTNSVFHFRCLRHVMLTFRQKLQITSSRRMRVGKIMMMMTMMMQCVTMMMMMAINSFSQGKLWTWPVGDQHPERARPWAPVLQLIQKKVMMMTMVMMVMQMVSHENQQMRASSSHLLESTAQWAGWDLLAQTQRGHFWREFDDQKNRNHCRHNHPTK